MNTTPKLNTNLSTNPILRLDDKSVSEKRLENTLLSGNKVKLPSGTVYEITNAGWIRVSPKAVSTKRNKKEMHNAVKEVRRNKCYNKKY